MHTSTWPSQSGPAPMPMVGRSTASRIRAATTEGTPSTTSAKAPASATATASATTASAASSVRPWTLNPPIAWTDWGVSPTWPDHGDARRRHDSDGVGHPTAALELDGLHAAFLHQAQRAGHSLLGGDLVASEGKIADHVGRGHASIHAATVVDHLVEGDGQGVVAALHDHAEAVAHEDHVDARGIDQPGHRVVVGGDQDEGGVLGLLATKVQDAQAGHLGLQGVGRAGGHPDGVARADLPARDCGSRGATGGESTASQDRHSGLVFPNLASRRRLWGARRTARATGRRLGPEGASGDSPARTASIRASTAARRLGIVRVVDLGVVDVEDRTAVPRRPQLLVPGDQDRGGSRPSPAPRRRCRAARSGPSSTGIGAPSTTIRSGVGTFAPSARAMAS